MKKFYLVAILNLIGLTAFSQTPFKIMTPVGGAPDLLTPGGIDVSGDTVVYCNEDLDSSIIVQGKLWIVNQSGASINGAVRRYEECMVNGTENYFCWDICWSAAVSVSGPMTIANGDTAKFFYGDYKSLGNEGASIIRYRFFNDDTPANFNEVYIKFHVGGSCLAIADCNVGLDEEEPYLSSVYPNPASDQINFEYNTAGKDGSIQIYDITGKQVRNYVVNSGSTKSTIGLEGLHSGIYFYTLNISGKPLATKKFIIKN
jgi:hypothetical protein